MAIWIYNQLSIINVLGGGLEDNGRLLEFEMTRIDLCITCSTEE